MGSHHTPQPSLLLSQMHPHRDTEISLLHWGFGGNFTVLRSEQFSLKTVAHLYVSCLLTSSNTPLLSSALVRWTDWTKSLVVYITKKVGRVKGNFLNETTVFPESQTMRKFLCAPTRSVAWTHHRFLRSPWLWFKKLCGPYEMLSASCLLLVPSVIRS